MTQKSYTRSKRFWDSKAESYAASAIADEKTYQRKLQETQSFLTPQMRVLEIGCGTGSTALAHAPFVEHILATDISSEMIGIAADKAEAAGIENVTFTCGTLEDLTVQPASFDAILGLNILHLLPNRAQAIEQAYQLLKPGGYFISSTACLGRTWFELLRAIVPLVKWLGKMPDLWFVSEAQLAKEITEAGFRIERQWHHGPQSLAVFIVAQKNYRQ